MRYLNKIVFINSAAINYAEINIDGNVHFIGTQGVGKSTTLRAILFFYNADKLKLGIEKGKRSFDEYYFPFGNSYIIYEVARETGPFCVLAFKSQGRVAFRFIEGAYDKSNFIGSDHKAMAWELARDTFPGHGSYSRKIDRYEEYRDILYGNNKGLPAEFRKYALIESRQYKNLPRTIQNVFLNSKLEAEFIKQTIIMSLNEEDVKIDLAQYNLHLRNFEEQLADISKWSTKNRGGQIVVRVLAEKITKNYAEVCYLEKEKTATAQLLIAAQKHVEWSYPDAQKQLQQEQGKLEAAQKKVAEADGRFLQKKARISAEITLLGAKLQEARKKEEHYEQLNISGIMQRVGKKNAWEQKKTGLLQEQELLSARFKEITHKYDALIKQVQIQLDDFVNAKNTEKNNQQGAFYHIKEHTGKQYEHIIAEIEKENREVILNAGQAIADKTNLIHALQMRKREVELRRYFDKEISETQAAIREHDQVVHAAGVEITGWKREIETIQKQWDLDIRQSEAEAGNQIARINERVAAAHKKIRDIEDLLRNNQDSLYAWLHANKPGWEQTIGKVIDAESVLFHAGLAPRMVGKDTGSFFGVELDLAEISKKVKGIADYEADQKQLAGEVDRAIGQISGLENTKLLSQEKLKKKYQPVILNLKSQISLREYESHKAVSGKEKAVLKLADWQTKAGAAQSQAIQALRLEIRQAEEEKQAAEAQLAKLEKNIRTQVEAKKKERDSKIAQEQAALQLRMQELDREIAAKKDAATARKAEILAQNKNDLHKEGADTGRLTLIERELHTIQAELQYIEENRDKVADYNKDKRELFDLVDVFKADKKLSETRLVAEQQKHDLAKEKLQAAVEELHALLAKAKATCREMEDDLHEFDRFTHTDVFLSLNTEALVFTEAITPPKRLTELINDLNDRSFSLINRMTDIRADISKFLSNFSPTNIFGFRTTLIENQDYLDFAENLREFLEEDKIGEYEKRSNEHFATLIRQVGKETTELVSKEAEIQKVINDINKDFEERNFAGVIKSINLRLSESANKIVVLLQEIRAFNNEHATTLGAANLFSTTDTESNNKKAVNLLRNFAAEIASTKQQEVNLSDTFELEFRIRENDNDSGWVEKLANVGSEGTDILVKAMINIMLLNVFKESASKRFKDFRLHCMMDEIGKLHPNNVKGILKFANDRNILLINSSPTSYNAMDYRYTYLLSKDNRNVTTVKKLVKNSPVHEVA